MLSGKHEFKKLTKNLDKKAHQKQNIDGDKQDLDPKGVHISKLSDQEYIILKYDISMEIKDRIINLIKKQNDG